VVLVASAASVAVERTITDAAAFARPPDRGFVAASAPRRATS
jgi:hypothetical protein